LLKTKKWRLKLVLGPSQNITKLPHLYSTQLLNTNESIILQNPSTIVIYDNPNLNESDLHSRQTNIKNIYSETYFFAKKIMAINSSTVVPIGFTNINDITKNYVKMLELLKSILILSESLNSSDLSSTSNLTVNFSVISSAIQTCLKQLSIMISIMYNKDKLSLSYRTINTIKQSLIIVVSIVDIIKLVLNPVSSYSLTANSLDPSNSNMVNRITSEFALDTVAFATLNTNLSSILSVVNLICDSCVMLTKRNIILNNNNSNCFPDPYSLAKLTTITATDTYLTSS
jgi:hypothetical protein